jgi:NTP pyrophosphatase (non-canonical NTP hydrolase)
MLAALNTAALGLSGEGGEISDIVKKLLFHGHEFNDEVRDKLIKELGDIEWYLSLASTALGVQRSEVAQTNVKKLMDRYPDGFETERSRQRYADQRNQGRSVHHYPQGLHPDKVNECVLSHSEFDDNGVCHLYYELRGTRDPQPDETPQGILNRLQFDPAKARAAVEKVMSEPVDDAVYPDPPNVDFG